MGVPLNHPFIDGICHEINNQPFFGGYPHDLGNLQLSVISSSMFKSTFLEQWNTWQQWTSDPWFSQKMTINWRHQTSADPSIMLVSPCNGYTYLYHGYSHGGCYPKECLPCLEVDPGWLVFHKIPGSKRSGGGWEAEPPAAVVGIFLLAMFEYQIPSGKRLHSYGKSPFLWENSLFLWPFSIAMLNYQRVVHQGVAIGLIHGCKNWCKVQPFFGAQIDPIHEWDMT